MDPIRRSIRFGDLVHISQILEQMPESRLEELREKAAKKQDDAPEHSHPSSASQQTDTATPTARFQPAPSIREAISAHKDIKNLLRPRRKNGIGHLRFDGDDGLRHRMEQMRMFLYRYSGGTSGWMAASLEVAGLYEEGEYRARQLRAWTRAFLADRHALPYSNMGTWNESLLDKFPELKYKLNLHLQGIGKYVRALDIVEYMADPVVQLRYGLEKGISLSTAQVWMHHMDYRWMKSPKGQFIDGHERADVVDYRNRIYLPVMEELDPRLRLWSKDGTEIPIPDWQEPYPRLPHVVLWYHDESTFYAHDRRLVHWVPKDNSPRPQPKGEGVTLMVADFVSADYGWLRSPDGTESAQVFFKAGKNRDGYFTSDDILEQVEKAMDILRRHYPNERHVFVYDNAPTHLKRAADALSARHMSKGPTKEGSDYSFGVEVNVTDEVTGKPVYSRTGSVLKKVPMTGAHFADGTPQSLYFPPNHPRAGVFKGMELILQERGIKASHLKAQCLNFKCPPPALDCCCRRILYNQPDFRDVTTLLEAACTSRGFRVIFLPKFHCELNPIEQCWGKAKREYRMYPPSSLLKDLEENVRRSLDSVELVTIRRFFTRVRRFMDGYRYGLTGKAAAYAAKKYRGHRVLPPTILQELELEDQLELVK